jgi:hypothetical protein
MFTAEAQGKSRRRKKRKESSSSGRGAAGMRNGGGTNRGEGPAAEEARPGDLGLAPHTADLVLGGPDQTSLCRNPVSHKQPDRAWEGVCLLVPSWVPAGHCQV